LPSLSYLIWVCFTSVYSVAPADMFLARRLASSSLRSLSTRSSAAAVSTMLRASPSFLTSQVRHHGYNLQNFDYDLVECQYNADGERVMQLFGEEVVVPLLEGSLEWVLTSPPDYHR
jgi:hypothetical protein